MSATKLANHYTDYTQATIEIFEEAVQTGVDHYHQEITSYHLIKSLLNNDVSLCNALSGVDISINVLMSLCDSRLNQQARSEDKPLDPTFDYVMRQAMYKSQNWIKQNNLSMIDNIALFINIIDAQPRQSPLATMFQSMPTNKLLKYYIQAESEIENMVSSNSVNKNHIAYKYAPIGNHLRHFTFDLIDKAERGELTPLIGRKPELSQIFQTFQRRERNNPLLMGDAGVGKTAIVHGLAQMIVNGDEQLPKAFAKARIFVLNMPAIRSTSQNAGKFDEILLGIIKDLKELRKQGFIPILFLDEIHSFMGKKESANDFYNASDILLPELTNNEICFIGATNPKSYKRRMEDESSLSTVFQIVQVKEPNKTNSIAILRGIKPVFEKHYDIPISDNALETAVNLSERYYPAKSLPSKAVLLLDDSVSRLRMELDNKPSEITMLENEIFDLQMERDHLMTQTTEASKRRIVEIDKLLEETQNKLKPMLKDWKENIVFNETLNKLNNTIANVKQDIQEAKEKGEFSRLAKLQNETLPPLEADYETLMEKMPHNTMSHLTSIHVATTLSHQIGIPIKQMMEGENERFLNIEEELRKRVIGQDRAVKAVADAVIMSKAGVSDPNRPLGSFLFAGSTGTGKTELAKTLAELLFDNKNSLIRFDMGEFMEKQSVSKFIGASAGYVGYDEGGILTEALKRNPHSVLLFDEIEKAHPDVWNLLLTILDEGFVTSAQGERVECKNTFIIFTSNMGAHHLMDLDETSDESDIQAAHEAVMDAIKATMKPEFLNRIDSKVIFNTLSNEQLHQIASLQMNPLVQRMKERHLLLSYNDGLLEFITEKAIEQSNGENYGARPIRRAIKDHVEQQLARFLLVEKVPTTLDKYRTISIIHDANKGVLKFNWMDPSLLEDDDF